MQSGELLVNRSSQRTRGRHRRYRGRPCADSSRDDLQSWHQESVDAGLRAAA